MEHCKRLSVARSGREAVVSQGVELLVPLHGLFDAAHSCCFPPRRPISHSNIEPSLLAKQGLETRKSVRPKN